MYTVYTYWNSDGVIAVLNAIVLIMGAGDFLGLMRTFAIAGMLVAVGVGLVRISAKEPLQYFIFLGLFYFGLFVPKVTVDVIDLRTGSVGTVANVPFGVGFFYSASSKIGKVLTEAFETTFQPVENLRFAKTGLGFGAKAFQEVTTVRVGDVRLSEAIRQFTGSCINPEILDSPTKYTQLVNSTNIWSLLNTASWLNPARSVTMPAHDGTIKYLSCTDAYTDINTSLDAEAPIQLNQLARRLFPDKQSNVATWAIAEANIAAALANVEGYMLNISRSALDQIKQGMIANAISDSGGTLAVARNDPGAMQVALAAKMAEAQANTAYRTMGLIGEAALPKFRNIIEIVIVAVFPIVMLLIILAGDKGGQVLKTYMITSIWVQLWAPLYAIVNFMMMGGMSSRFQAALEGAANQTIQNTPALTMTAFKEASLAGALVFAIPVIAYALVKGGEVAMSGAMSGLTGTASGAASSAGSSVGAGNITAGTTSWGNHSSNNMSANKWDTNGSMSTGMMTMSRGGVTQAGDLGGAGGSPIVGSNRSDLQGLMSNMGPYTASAQAMAGQTVQSAYSTAMRQGDEATTSLMSTVGSALGQNKGRVAKSGSSADVAATWATNRGGSTGRSADDALTSSVKSLESRGFSRNEAVQLAIAAGLGEMGFGKAMQDLAKAPNASDAMKAAAGSAAKATAPFSGDMAYKSDAGLKDLFSKSREVGSTQAFKTALAETLGANKGLSTSVTGSAGNERTQGTTSSYESALQAQAAARQAYTRASELTSTSANTATGSTSVAMDLANRAQQALGHAGFVQMFGNSANAPAAAAFLQGLLEQTKGQLGGGFTPTSGSVPQAGGAAGAKLEGAVMNAVSADGVPVIPQGSVSAVEAQRGMNDRAAGPGPSSTPPPVPDPGGGQAPVSAEGVKALTNNTLGNIHAATNAGQSATTTAAAPVTRNVDDALKLADGPGSLSMATLTQAVKAVPGVGNMVRQLESQIHENQGIEPMKRPETWKEPGGSGSNE